MYVYEQRPWGRTASAVEDKGATLSWEASAYPMTISKGLMGHSGRFVPVTRPRRREDYERNAWEIASLSRDWREEPPWSLRRFRIAH